ncbi:MAG TPA: alkaline phosphatase family protein, partial [Alphaproteobacteria bacterium]|nr:alkaline phosphatase family protein [Alphaproteobacteria bacterium]
MLPTLYLRARATSLAACIALLALAGPVLAQENPIQSGPMVGYSEMREVALWVQ